MGESGEDFLGVRTEGRIDRIKKRYNRIFDELLMQYDDFKITHVMDYARRARLLKLESELDRQSSELRGQKTNKRFIAKKRLRKIKGRSAARRKDVYS